VQRPAPVAARELGVPLGGRGQRAFGVEGDDGVAGVGGEAVQDVPDVLRGRELPGAQGHAEFAEVRQHPAILTGR
jgi:hypothetical protein